MKKVFALVLALILALSLFACGKKSEDTGTAAGAETKPVSETAAENTGADAPDEADNAEETPANTAEDPAQAVTPAENTTPSGSSSASNSSKQTTTSSPASSGSTPAAPAGASGSSSGSSSAAAPVSSPVSQPVHEHSWQAVYREVEKDDYEMREVSYCVTCGQDMTGWSNSQIIEHSDYHMDRGESDQWRSEGRYIKVGSHIEQELTGYSCSCGATKTP